MVSPKMSISSPQKLVTVCIHGKGELSLQVESRLRMGFPLHGEIILDCLVGQMESQGSFNEEERGSRREPELM